MKSLIFLCILSVSLFSLAQWEDQAISMDGFYEVSGTTTNYVIKNSDGFVDFSLVIPAMTSEELINFDMAKIMSPVSDQVSVLSKTFEVPSNLSLPQQTESYFLSFTLEKLTYRAYLSQPGKYNMYALTGKFPIKDAVNGFQDGKSIFEMVNLFNFSSGGTKAIDVKGPMKNVDLAVDAIKFDKQLSIKAPNYAKDKAMLAISLFKQKDEFYPADLKQVLPTKTAKLVVKSNSSPYILSLLMNNSQQSYTQYFDGNFVRSLREAARAGVDLGQLSYALLPVSGDVTSPDFLPLVSAPQFNKAQAKLTVAVPNASSVALAYATVITLSEVQAGGSESFPMDVKRVLWSTTAMGWQKELKLSTDVMNLIKKKKYVWDVLFLATPKAENDNAVNWDKVTHVTRNSVQF